MIREVYILRWFFISVRFLRVMDNRKIRLTYIYFNRNPALRILNQTISQRFHPKNPTYRGFKNFNVYIEEVRLYHKLKYYF